MKPSKVLVVGDVIIDEYTRGTALGLSAETPTVVVRQGSVEKFFGGAGLVVRHLLRLGKEVDFLTAGGADHLWDELYRSTDRPTDEEFGRLKIFDLTILGWTDGAWRLTRKRRFYAGEHKLIQYDVLNDGELDGKKIARFKLREFNTWEGVGSYSDVVLCDNRHGMTKLLRRVLRAVKDIPEGDPRPDVHVDSQASQKKSNLNEEYFGADYYYANQRELADICAENEPSHVQIAGAIGYLTSTGYLLAKRGPAGAQVFSGAGLCAEAAAPIGTTAVDTTGAGDAFLAAFVASPAFGLHGKLRFAIDWASASVKMVGTRVPQLDTRSL